MLLIIKILSRVLNGSFSSPSWNLQLETSPIRWITEPLRPIIAADAFFGINTRIWKVP